MKESKQSILYFQILQYRPNLLYSMAAAFGMPFLMAAGLKLIHDILQFMGPVMLQRIIDYLGDDNEIVFICYSYYIGY